MPVNREPTGQIGQVLRADYGDKQQAALNAKKIDPVQARRIEEKYRCFRAAHPPREVPKPLPKPHASPPGWNTKVLGPAFGDCNRGKAPRKEAKRNAAILPGHGRIMPLHNPQNRPPPPLPYQRKVSHNAREVARLLDTMRAVLRRRATVHLVEKVVLLRAFGQVIGKKDVAVEVGDVVTVAQFRAAWKLLGVDVHEAEAIAIFNKHGQDKQGRMPVLVFTHALLMGANRQLMAGGEGVQKGPYEIGKPATHVGKILYPQSRKGVFPPSDWDPAAAVRSAAHPDLTLRLEHVHGYEGVRTTSPNVFVNRDGRIVYYTAAVAIVYDKAAHRQRFFLGHNDDISCLAPHPERALFATGQVAAAETQDGPGTIRRADPCVIVWDSTTMQQVTRIFHGEGFRGVQAAAFSPNGSKLVTVCTDNGHTMSIWDWRSKSLLLRRNTHAGSPPSVYGVAWSPFDPNRIATYGQNHIMFWTLLSDPKYSGQKGASALAADLDAGQWAKVPTHTIWSACWLPCGHLLTGSEGGELVTWVGAIAREVVPAHGKGVTVHRPDGTPSCNGVRAIVLQPRSKVILTGGGDGCVGVWALTDAGALGARVDTVPIILSEQAAAGQVAAPLIRALDCLPGSRDFVVGTAASEIWEVDKDPSILLRGQQADVLAVAPNPCPEFDHIFATVCDSCVVTVWSALTHKVVKSLKVAGRASAAAFSPDGHHLAVGLASGGLQVYHFYPSVQQIHWSKPLRAAISVLAFSPDGRLLAAGGHEHFIDLFSVPTGYKKVGRLMGHSSTIRSIDWSVDSTTLSSMDQAYEVLYFDVRKAAQSKDCQRDTKWKTWTSVLGFPVMGIWPDYSDGTDVNAVDRSPDGKYLATADDFGKVKLFAYPCVVDQAPHYAHCGHSSHVMSVRWSGRQRYVVSVGGKDRSVFQWRPSARKVVDASAPLVTPWAPDGGHDHGVYWRPSDPAPQRPTPQLEAAQAGGQAPGAWR